MVVVDEENVATAVADMSLEWRRSTWLPHLVRTLPNTIRAEPMNLDEIDEIWIPAWDTRLGSLRVTVTVVTPTFTVTARHERIPVTLFPPPNVQNRSACRPSGPCPPHGLEAPVFPHVLYHP